MRLCALALCAFACACAEPGSAAPADAASDAPAVEPCGADRDCDDGSYCSGEERCRPGAEGADARGCVRAGAPCPALCDEPSRTCVAACALDADSDGMLAASCGGIDCDDGDADRFPGNSEECDPEGHDEDCDPATFGVQDADGDGWPSDACCNGVVCGTDCDDEEASTHPGQSEACNGRDDDCDGMTDEGVVPTWVVDGDGDGHGDATEGAARLAACHRPSGWARFATDCDDAAPSVHPAALERCDGAGIDEDCDGVADPPERCECMPGETVACFQLRGRCSAGTQVCSAGAWSACSIAPVVETCNADDDDCDGATDEGVQTRCFTDADRDDLAPLGAAELATCGACPPSTTDVVPLADAYDCDDTDARVPGEQACDQT